MARTTQSLKKSRSLLRDAWPGCRSTTTSAKACMTGVVPGEQGTQPSAPCTRPNTPLCLAWRTVLGDLGAPLRVKDGLRLVHDHAKVDHAKVLDHLEQLVAVGEDGVGRVGQLRQKHPAPERLRQRSEGCDRARTKVSRVCGEWEGGREGEREGGRAGGREGGGVRADRTHLRRWRNARGATSGW